MKRRIAFLICFSIVVSVSSSIDAGENEPQVMKPYTVRLRYTDAYFKMLPIPGGQFMMGSPSTEKDRLADEGPQHLVKIEPFWMAKCETTWNEYNAFRLKIDIQQRKKEDIVPSQNEIIADAITRPSKEYRDMSYGMGIDGFPAVNMTQYAAKTYCKWLSAITGDYYRLPTEAEWEYACRAGTTTAYSFGDDPSKLDQYAWHYTNSGEQYRKVGKKKPNPWGLHDMHGNVAEWCLDQYVIDFYNKFNPEEPAIFPIAVPATLYPRVVRGGSWDDDAEYLRSASRMKSKAAWKRQDPQLPKSKWYHTDSDYVGFRVVRPLKRPTLKEIEKYVLYPDYIMDMRDETK